MANTANKKEIEEVIETIKSKGKIAYTLVTPESVIMGELRVISIAPTDDGQYYVCGEDGNRIDELRFNEEGLITLGNEFFLKDTTQEGNVACYSLMNVYDEVKLMDLR